MITRENFLSNFVICAPIASIKPPSKIQMTGLDHVLTYFSQLSVISKGTALSRKNTANPITKKLTANGGMDSVIHSDAATIRMKSACRADCSRSAGAKNSTNATEPSMIKISVVRLRVTGHFTFFI